MTKEVGALIVTYSDGNEYFEVSSIYLQNIDTLSILCRKIKKTQQMFGFIPAPPKFEVQVVTTVTVDSAPGCILNTVQLLIDGNDRKKTPVGLKLSPITKFPVFLRPGTLLKDYLYDLSQCGREWLVVRQLPQELIAKIGDIPLVY